MQALSGYAPRLIERLLDPLCALLLFLVVSTGAGALSVLVPAVAAVAIAWIAWRHRGWWVALVVTVAWVALTAIVGPAVVCGLLVVVGYYAVSLWCLGAPPIERLLDLPLERNGSTRTVREHLHRAFQKA